MFTFNIINIKLIGRGEKQMFHNEIMNKEYRLKKRGRYELFFKTFWWKIHQRNKFVIVSNIE